MRIKRLKLSGFKSFVEPSELRIEPGLTGVVGPNGCGKSNLLEAIRWVMGENSAKSMRGGGMEDVIFAGTDQRPARDFAEVSLLAERSPGEALLDRLPGARPAHNDDDDGELEIVRRIERGAGSAYRANGRDVRAKDVALIFADAATGAHSPALVSQGRIAAVIAAKPAERRQMLEEAAGIAGLHVRRKDAEQKLRATETNLSRLEDILRDAEARAGLLKRQARAAERYRKLSREITVAEGRMIFARWRDAAAAADAARAEARAAEDRVASIAGAQRELQAAQADAVRALGDARGLLQRERDALAESAQAIATAEQRLANARERLADLDRQAARIASDSESADALTRQAGEALERLEADRERLKAEIATAEGRRPEMERALDRAERAMRDSEVELARAAAEQARIQADIRVARVTLDAARTRRDRIARDAEALDAQLAALGEASELQAAFDEAVAALETTRAGLAARRQEREAVEAERPALIERRSEQESALSAARAELASMEREIAALTRQLAAGSDDAGVVGSIRVAPGYEAALAAALGEDLAARTGVAEGDGRFWTGSEAGTPPAPPPGCDRLAEHVTAPDALAARLARIWVADADTGQPLGSGERLVTRGGRMRRWDGFVAIGDGALAAENLARRNRLEACEGEQPELARRVEAAEAALDATAERLASLQSRAADLGRAVDALEAGERRQLRARDQAEDSLNRDAERRAEIDDKRTAIAAERAEAETAFADAERAHAAQDDDGAATAQVETLQKRHDGARAAMQAAQAELSAADQALASLRERLAVARAEIKGWQARSSEAMQRLADMRAREEQLAADRAALAGLPERLTAELTEYQAARGSIETRLRAASDAADACEGALKSIEAKLAEAGEALATAREDRAGASARAESQEARRAEMGRVLGERFQCPPPLLPGKLEFEADDVDDASQESGRHEKLVQDRERIGPVNLLAADELETAEAEIATGRAEIEELSEAIHRLRGSIGSLNREGRQRLRAAFEAVDGHFQRLFVRLFNGGTAHLALIDSDDPLEAGLEIMAQPPGKKLASLTLLSGGEQALTAIALIFALFLTNPAPICVLDEVDAPLDDANIERFCDLLDQMVAETETRYLIVTHNAVTMSRMHRLFGVTMIEKGVSRLVSVDLGGAEELLAAE